MANNIALRGFGSMDLERRKAIASLGGKEGHRQGVAHQWTSEEARAAGRKGGLKSAANRKAEKLAELQKAV